MQKKMKVSMVSIEDGITALGFKKVTAVIRKLNPEAQVKFIATGNLYSITTHLFPSKKREFQDFDVAVISKNLAKSDLVCLSSMTPSAPYVEKIIKTVKKINPKTFILWGGVHSIIYSDEAIKFADAICTGEGEKPIAIFYEAFSRGKNFYKTPGMWFKKDGKIIKNKNLGLNSNSDLESFPYLFYGLDCQIYDLKLKRFRQFTHRDYVSYNGLSYRTVWTLGCPFSCTYCANDSFISIDKNYRIIRSPSVDKIITEVERGISIYPFVSSVAFYDDNFIVLPLLKIKEFAEKYKKRVGIPFVVFGMHPNFITSEKVKLLSEAGMNRCRMGIQSGSERILKFYNRPTPLVIVKRSVQILSEAAKKYKMIPPSYDIITDNPIETKKDIIQTLKFLYNLERPYTLTIFSLRAYPKTRLWDYFTKCKSVDIRNLTSSYLDTRRTMSAVILYLMATLKPSRLLFNFLLKKVRGYSEEQKYYSKLFFITKSIYLFSRGIEHLKKLDFSTLAGPWVYSLWKMGLLKSNENLI